MSLPLRMVASILALAALMVGWRSQRRVVTYLQYATGQLETKMDAPQALDTMLVQNQTSITTANLLALSANTTATKQDPTTRISESHQMEESVKIVKSSAIQGEQHNDNYKTATRSSIADVTNLHTESTNPNQNIPSIINMIPRMQPTHPITTNTTAISPEKPVFVLSLPNSANLVWPRYFTCAGYSHVNDMAHYWTQFHPKVKPRVALGKCLKQNYLNGHSLTDNCGRAYSVYMELQQLDGPNLRGRYIRDAQCFDVVMYQGALEAFGQSYPNGATMINVVQSPQQWFETLPKDFPKHWKDWCNPSHPGAPFPNETTSTEVYIEFYNLYQSKLRQFATQFPQWNYIELDISQQSTEEIGTMLQQQLKINEQCWTDSYQGVVPMDLVDDPKAPAVLEHQPLPRDLRYPILVTALPKSGTTTVHEFFMCATGRWSTAHQQVLNVTSKSLTTIGECMVHNTKHNHSFLNECGNARVFSDVGIFNPPRLCYYPTLHGGLQTFYESYPHGTILHVVRNSTSWYASTKRWRNFPSRWSGANAACHNAFPPPRSSPDTWVDWYDQHTANIREFAQQHPTLTYLEIPLSLKTGPLLQHLWGLPADCWTQSNVNTIQKGGPRNRNNNDKKKKKGKN